jgi:hypothetical protein
LDAKDWQLLSEVIAVMRNCHNLAMESQTEAPGYNCFSYYSVWHCRSNLSCIRQLQCYDVRKSWPPNTLLKDIAVIGLNTQHLMKETKEFIDCLNDEYKRYFPSPDDDQKVMMVFHLILYGMVLSKYIWSCLVIVFLSHLRFFKIE